MLTLTNTASEAIRALVQQSPAEDTAGIRIAPGMAPGGEGAALELSLVDAPQAADETVEDAGATVYLEPQAAQLLEDKVLDAEVREEGVAFQVRDQGIGDEPSMDGRGGPVA